MKKNDKRLLGHISHRKGLSFIDEYGKERAADIKNKISSSSKGKLSGDKNPSKRPEVKDKIKKSLVIYFLNNPQAKENIRDKAINRVHNDITKKNMSLVRKGKTYEELFGKEKAELYKQNISKSKKGIIFSEDHIKNIGKASKERWKNEEFFKKMFKKFQIKPNKKELLLFDIIKENNFPFNYVGDGQIIIGGKCPDFLSSNPKHIIELFGDYWHSKKPNIPYNQTEEGTINHYNKYGYKTLIIWEHELICKEDVINKIRGFLDG